MAKIGSLHLGDRVQLTGKFLKSTGQYTGSAGLDKWTIVGFWGDGKFALVNEPIDQAGYEDLPPDQRPKWRSIAVGNLQKLGKQTADLKRAKRSKPRRRVAKRSRAGRRARRVRGTLRRRLSKRRSRTMSLPKVTGMSKFKAQAAYDRANSASRSASREFQKTRELYRAGKLTDAFFLAEQAKHKAALAAFDAAEADLKAVLAHEESKREMSLPKAPAWRTRAAFYVKGKWKWLTWNNHTGNSHKAILDKADEIGADKWDFGGADHELADRANY